MAMFCHEAFLLGWEQATPLLLLKLLPDHGFQLMMTRI
jgi:hypothetical protein